MVTEQGSWFSFSKNEPFNNCLIDVSSNGKFCSKKNISTRDQIMDLLPVYEHNPKHRKIEYWRVGGEYVSPMPLEQSQAQDLLLRSILDEGGDRWARHEVSNEYYRFKRTHVNNDVYHGFQVRIEEVPDGLLHNLDSN